MSLMTESLLLHAQYLRESGMNDKSINVLSTIISMCDATDAVVVDVSSPPPSDGRGDRATTTRISIVNQRMRDMASLILATMLLQRAGRVRRGNGRRGR